MVAKDTVPLTEQLSGSTHELSAPFVSAEKPKESWRIGAEAEKFGVLRDAGRPLGYAPPGGVLEVFEWLCKERGYSAVREGSEGPVIAIERPGTALTLEPGAQFELSAGAAADMHEVADAIARHAGELLAVGDATGVDWVELGFHPTASRDALPWVPKQRYPVMREYLPTRGDGALDMMQRTATVQANFDYSDERDALEKLVLCLRMAPLANAWLANSPYVEGRASGLVSKRGETWLRMEPERSGLIAPLWSKAEPGYADYVEWALDAPMFLIKREGRIVPNTGQPFRSFLRDGYQGYRATHQDWQLHLHTLFPEARLKGTLEVRPVDSLPESLALGAIALFTGILYDETSLAAARELLRPITFAEVDGVRRALVTFGLDVRYGQSNGYELARDLLTVSRAGLERRGRHSPGGDDESKFLDPLVELLEERITPAGRLLGRLGPAPSPGEIIAATRL